jgi:glycine dehydrogenase
MASVDKANSFVDRHIGPDVAATNQMLEFLNYKSTEELISAVLPTSIATELDNANLPKSASEVEVISELRERAKLNQNLTSMIGLGYYNTITPAVIKRGVLENPAWYTAYTPYQPEISQGRLETLFLFQTVITDLTGLSISNASMLDEPTAAAEAMGIARRSWTGEDEAPFLIDRDTHPQTIAVIETRALPLGIKIELIDIAQPIPRGFGLLISYPGSTGALRNPARAIAEIKEHGGLAIAATDLLALTLLKAPGEWGFDAAVGSAQRFGVPMGFGGPHAGLLAVRTGLERTMPGRLVGESVDANGARAYRLALQTREQHIRREKATSNICTAQVLLANISALYAMWHGPRGLEAIAERVHFYTALLIANFKASGCSVVTQSYFDTFTVQAESGAQAQSLVSKALSAGINISLDESTTIEDLINLSVALELKAQNHESLEQLQDVMDETFAEDFLRTTPYLTNKIFTGKRSETSMMRYLRALADKDLALDRTMIPLGSCTMKLNAATEMESITWPEFANLHPFAPADQSEGTRSIISDLQKWLCEITGYDAISLQPNAGSQGEFAGLLAIRKYHLTQGNTARDICLIPSSAHGTNAASAVMAGMKVVVIACDELGNVDLADLKAKIATYKDSLAALMVTYPSTHGVFEEAIGEICAAVHDAGGQVYVDGANLNALVGLAKPGKFGADVSHLNLHKTFCIPHGGGGPGVGPVGVRAHLAPYLPSHPLDSTAGPDTGVGPISGAPFGSAGILNIPWAYIRLMSAEGLKNATSIAIVSANYLAKSLNHAYPVLYRGKSDLIAHECIIDLRPLTKISGVSVDDVAKRLMDHGFHAPTVSFPVAGTLMIEPTESEDLTELNRFINAMLSIRAEIQQVIDGKMTIEQSPLRSAPHTAQSLLGEWNHAYSREIGGFPNGLPEKDSEPIDIPNKYWPPVGRIDGVHGDRNLICSCPRPEELAIQS